MRSEAAGVNFVAFTTYVRDDALRSWDIFAMTTLPTTATARSVCISIPTLRRLFLSLLSITHNSPFASLAALDRPPVPFDDFCRLRVFRLLLPLSSASLAADVVSAAVRSVSSRKCIRGNCPGHNVRLR